jgi:hypothetical protein
MRRDPHSSASRRSLPRGAGALVALVLGLVPLPPAAAQEVLPTTELERRIFVAFQAAEYQRALELIEQFLQVSPNHVDMLYNAACAHARLGQRDEAAAALLRAVKAGFLAFDAMRRDPDLEPVRDHPVFQAILEAAQRSSDSGRHQAQRQWRLTHGDTAYRYETDEARRLDFATALDEVSHQEMRRMLERQADQMIAALFGQPPAHDVLIAVPTPEHARALFGGDELIGGIYQHSMRRLVARDIGGALRHEFFHALHYGHMERLGQEHPIWIQEGMAALYEDYELDAAGNIRFLPNHRQEIVQRRAGAGILMGWSALMGLDAARFMDQAGHLYPQVRSIFRFLAERGLLERWYAAYVGGFDRDPSGGEALEQVFGQPLAQVETEWRRWVAALPEVDTDIDYGDASLGIETTLRGSNDGVRVDVVHRGSAAAAAGIRRGDVIVAIAGRPTRSILELQQVIAAKAVGERVQVRLRRRGEYQTLEVVLRPLAPIPSRLP